MHSANPPRAPLATIAALAKALATAVLSLVLGAAVCLGLLLGTSALAG